MKLIVKQVKTTHWLDLYDIFDEDNKVVYTVKQELSWGKKFIFYDSNKKEVAYIHEKAISLLPAEILTAFAVRIFYCLFYFFARKRHASPKEKKRYLSFTASS